MSEKPGWVCHEIIGISIINPRSLPDSIENLYNKIVIQLGMLLSDLSPEQQLDKITNRLWYDYSSRVNAGESMTFMEDVQNRIRDVKKLNFTKDIGEDKVRAVIEAFNNLKGALKTLRNKYGVETAREPELALLDELQEAITNKMMELYNASSPDTAGKLLASILNVDIEDAKE